MALPAVRTLNSVDRFDPFREFENLFSQLSRYNNQGWSPLADVTETETGYVVELDVPGVQREDVTVDLNGTDLSITGELKERESKGLFRHRTRRTGKFSYRLSLPRNLDADKVEAKLADGVLTVTVGKKDAAKPRRIEITA
ncbi:Hsp20/alpha crystallin family protein [Kibdelosporangium aridum]|uniref:Hsp20/alpha crystallin family protein n=1 Tax=Kibdelosporangium aridum TaxID=2030 RepID=A0A428Z7H7_KIBAR|nr:Hsp20/alpha crystallin family protein [Kibdelosporangium aridum]RSM83581.1 Hsp20/alpha crystallin family protein [Kibdelosporangium aridum]